MTSQPFDPEVAPVPVPAPTASPAGGRPGFFRSSLVAAMIASEGVELWIPGALASIAFLGWVPFVLAVVTLPSVGDLGFFGSSLGISPNFPWNVVVLALAVALGIVAASITIAVGEAALQRGIDRVVGAGVDRRSSDEDAARLWVIQVIAALPAIAVSAATLVILSGVAQTEYQSPDIGGPFAFRIARDVWPYLAGLAICLLLGQAFGGAAQRAVRGRSARSTVAALAFGLREMGRHPVRLLGLTLLSDLALAAWLFLSWALLHVLWAPIGRAVGRGALLESGTALLLVGFVAIWLCLVTAGGALQAWSSTWWSIEIGRDVLGEGGGG